MMADSDAKRVLSAYETARKAQTQDEYEEAIADLSVLARESVTLAVLASMAKIQIERPALIPVALVVTATSIFLSVGRLLFLH
jgi:hypothetical protein